MTSIKPWKDRWICIGGGTAGFGRLLAQEFAMQGAKVAILGRDVQRGEQLAEHLQKTTGSEIRFFAVDLASQASIANSDWQCWLDQTPLSVAIAAAGQSDRGYLDSMTTIDAQHQWEANVLTALHFSQACIPSLSQSSGTLVHIGSLAGLIAAPGMGGYCLAKHAVTALSRQMRLELKGKGVRVLLVSPGPIARDDADDRYEHLVMSKDLPTSLKRPGGGANLKAIDPEWLSRRILRAIEGSELELVVPSKARWLAALGNLFPSLWERFLGTK